jgi:hypothetical protein
MLDLVMLGIDMLIVVLMSAILGVSYVECCSAMLGVVILGVVLGFTDECRYRESCFVLSDYAECCYAGCHYAECRMAMSVDMLNIVLQ